MGFTCGIVGLPNVGKSTLFNALTRSQVPAENYPFCTIDPNVGIVPVPDARLAKLPELVPTQQVVPTVIEFDYPPAEQEKTLLVSRAGVNAASANYLV